MNSSVGELCPKCGLCCNGVLFADVELQKGDDAGQFTELGLALKRKGLTRAFAQPCRCFDGKLCRIYPQRPQRCRAFECGLLKQVQAGRMKPKMALRKIAQAHRLAETVRRLLRQLGQSDERLALTKRYAQVMRLPIDMANDANVETHRRLLLAMNELMQVLQRDFLS